ncbi:snRNA-activating protein complex subunit 3-like [Amphiura filiformis]|uniref:snRNA-activating protein complex subunit 3-like n=1 Tax=Amphiura filiformis TaxID=82378 RepID=UPI003B21B87E
MDDYMSGDETVPIYDEFVKPEDLNVSPLIHVGSFVSKWESVLDTVDYLPNAINPEPEIMCDLLGANKEIVKELGGVCDPSGLDAKMPVKKALDKMELEEAISATKGHRLSTLQLRMDSQKNTKAKAMHSVSIVRGRFRSNRSTFDMEYHHISKPGNAKHIVQPMTLLQLWFFKPLLTSGKDRESKVKMMFDREVLLLSTQKLKDIKKMITCVTDEALLAEECSECPDLPQDQRAKDVFKSSFFFIDDTFYVDESHPSCKDLSEPIRKWASGHRTGVSADMQVESMEDVTMESLNIRLGYPYLYCHQGECEHVFLFSDIRLMHDMDNKDLAGYPMMINKCEARRIHCIVCNVFTAKWITREDSFSPNDPSFFCNPCFRMLHYDADGKKLGSFKAWPYTDANIFS